MIPVFLVPLSVLLHLASWQKLRQIKRETGDLKPLLTDRQHSVKIESAKNEVGERLYRIGK